MKTKSMLLKAQKLTPKEMGFVEGGTNEADKPLDGGTLDEVIFILRLSCILCCCAWNESNNKDKSFCLNL